MPRADKARCHYCGGRAATSIKQQRSSRDVGKGKRPKTAFRPICLEQKCWEAYWNEEV